MTLKYIPFDDISDVVPCFIYMADEKQLIENYLK